VEHPGLVDTRSWYEPRASNCQELWMDDLRSGGDVLLPLVLVRRSMRRPGIGVVAGLGECDPADRGVELPVARVVKSVTVAVARWHGKWFCPAVADLSMQRLVE
jgi:hypothetical protein